MLQPGEDVFAIDLVSTRDLDELLDAADDRRFKPFGLRAGGQLAAATAAEYAFSLTLEPEPGWPGDRSVLSSEALRGPIDPWRWWLVPLVEIAP